MRGSLEKGKGEGFEIIRSALSRHLGAKEIDKKKKKGQFREKSMTVSEGSALLNSAKRNQEKGGGLVREKKKL